MERRSQMRPFLRITRKSNSERPTAGSYLQPPWDRQPIRVPVEKRKRGSARRMDVQMNCQACGAERRNPTAREPPCERIHA